MTTTTACPVCNAGMRPVFRMRILRKHDVEYRHCSECGYLCTEKPYWLDEAYSDAIVVEDTGIMQRNLVMAARLAAVLYFRFDPRARYVDVAGGYGVLVRVMRDLGLDFYWSDRYSRNLLARGFEADGDPRPFAGVTAFEVLEHVEDPVGFISETLARYGARVMIFSTLLYEGAGPPPPDWWYYAPEAGQHVSFYQARTLQKIANRLGLHFQTAHKIHVLSDKPVGALAYRMLTSAAALPLAIYARQRLGSRTIADQDRMVRRNGRG